MSTNAVETEMAQDAADVMEARTLILSLSAGSIRTRAKVKRERVQKMAEALRTEEPESLEDMADGADEIHVSKELLKVDEVAAVISELGAVRNLIRSNAQPTRSRRGKDGKGVGVSFLKNGLYLYALPRMDWAEGQIREGQGRIDALLAKLEPRWDDILREDERRLAPLGLHDPRDYPTLAAIREAVTFRYSWFRFSVPSELKQLNPVAFAAERAKAREMYAELYQTVRLGYAETLEDFVTKIRAALVPGEDGKTRVLRQATLDNLTEFLTNYRLQDVTGFTELASLVDKARLAMRGVDAEVLRSEQRASDRVAATLEEIGDALKPLVIEQQRRVRLKD